MQYFIRLKSARARGFSLIEVMVAIGLMGILGYFMVSLLEVSLKGTTQTNVTIQAQGIKTNLMNILSNEAAWANTVRRDSRLNCLASLYANPPQPATCGASTVDNFVVYGPDPGGSTVLYDFRSPTSGFTGSGAPCNTYDDAKGNDRCPFHYNLTAKIVCSAGTCANPSIELIGRIMYKPNTQAMRVSFSTASGGNGGKYDFDFFRGAGGSLAVQGADIEATCSVLGGTYVAGPPPTCSNMASALCHFLGGNWDGSKCNLLTGIGSCPGGQTLTGFDGMGQKICQPPGLIGASVSRNCGGPGSCTCCLSSSACWPCN